MNRLFFLIPLLCGALFISAQTQDASTVYSEFQRQNNILRSTASHSVEHEQAASAMLRLYPQLYYHAANFSQRGNAANALVFAQAYVDMAMMPEFRTMGLEKSENYPTMIYFVASNYYNRKDYAAAARYLELYVQCGEQKNRKTVFLYWAQALSKQGKMNESVDVLDLALQEYPTDQNMLALSINSRLEAGQYENALPYIEQSLRARPGDSKLLSLKAQCLEGMGQYEQAANLYGLLAEQQKSLNIYKHYALNLYNCAVYYNEISPDRSQEFLRRAIPVLRQVVANDPTSVPYTTSLGMAYLYTDQYDELRTINDRLRAMGISEIESGHSTKDMAMMKSDLKRPVAASHPATSSPSSSLASVSTTSSSTLSSGQKSTESEAKPSSDFRVYAQALPINKVRIVAQTTNPSQLRMHDVVSDKDYKNPYYVTSAEGSNFRLGLFSCDGKSFVKPDNSLDWAQHHKEEAYVPLDRQEGFVGYVVPGSMALARRDGENLLALNRVDLQRRLYKVVKFRSDGLVTFRRHSEARASVVLSKDLIAMGKHKAGESAVDFETPHELLLMSPSSYLKTMLFEGVHFRMALDGTITFLR